MKRLLALVLLVGSLTAQAGVIKELVLEHQEAVSMRLFGHTELDRVDFVSTDFTRATNPEAKVALKSVVNVFVPEWAQWSKVTCESQFRELAPRRFELIETSCR